MRTRDPNLGPGKPDGGADDSRTYNEMHLGDCRLSFRPPQRLTGMTPRRSSTRKSTQSAIRVLLERAGDREEGQCCQQTSAKVDVKASATVFMWNLDLLGAAVCVVVAPPVVLSREGDSQRGRQMIIVERHVALLRNVENRLGPTKRDTRCPRL